MGRRKTIHSLKGEGGGVQLKFYPYEKEQDAEQVLVMVQVHKGFGVVLTWQLDVLAIVMGRPNKLSSL